MAAQAASLVISACAVIGYLCQYNEIRNATLTQAGIWLRIQAGLALLRVVIGYLYQCSASPG